MELCTELFYAIIPTLFLCFLLICYPYILLHFWCFLFSFMSLFCLPSITEQQVSPHRLPTQDWLKNHWLSSNTKSISNSAILRNNYISLLSDLCACVLVKKNGVAKEAIVLRWAVRIASRDFKPGKKRWASALLNEKCCCFVRKPSWKSDANLN